MYNILKEKVKLEICKQKRKWANQEIINNKNVWMLLKKEIQPKKNNISTLFPSNTNPTPILNDINKVFSSVFSTSDDIEYNPICSKFKNSCLFSIREVEEQLTKVNIKKSSLNDGIPKILYKMCYSSLAKPLTNIFNTALTQ